MKVETDEGGWFGEEVIGLGINPSARNALAEDLL